VLGPWRVVRVTRVVARRRDYVRVEGPGIMALLAERVAAAPSGSARSWKRGPAASVLMEIVDEAVGTSAGSSRDVESAGVVMLMDGYLPAGTPTVEVFFAWQRVSRAVEKVIAAAAEAGTRVYCGFAASGDGFPAIFSVRSGRWGVERGRVLSVEAGTVGVVELYRARERANTVYVAGAGMGAGRVWAERSDSPVGVFGTGLVERRAEAIVQLTNVRRRTTLEARGDEELERLAARNGIQRVDMSGLVWPRDVRAGDVFTVVAAGVTGKVEVRSLRVAVRGADQRLAARTREV